LFFGQVLIVALGRAQQPKQQKMKSINKRSSNQPAKIARAMTQQWHLR